MLRKGRLDYSVAIHHVMAREIGRGFKGLPVRGLFRLDC